MAKLLNSLGVAPRFRPALRIDLIGRAHMQFDAEAPENDAQFHGGIQREWLGGIELSGIILSRAFKKRFRITGAEFHQALLGDAVT